MTEALKRRVAIITGGSRGIGLAIAQAFAAEGIAMALIARSGEAVRGASDTIRAAGGRAIPLAADVTDEQSVAWVVEETVRQLGPVDLLINNAGSASAAGPVWEIDPKTWWKDVTTNLFGTFLYSRAVLPGMIARRQGRIINVVSGFGIPTRPDSTPSPYASAYSSSKAAVMVLTANLAAMTHVHGIRVFGLRPGFVRTAMLEDGARSPTGARWLPELQAVLDSGRLNSPELAARWVTLLASGEADALSGRVLSATYDMTNVMAESDEIRRDGRYVLRLIE
jgi:NAD(P)-dependent dehydrogenase (short-subunit alcohol dehydrogenase family)